MKKILLVSLMGVLSMANNAIALEKASSFRFDKGSVDVTYDPKLIGYKLSYDTPDACQAHVSIDKTKDGIVSVSHDGNFCPEGAHFQLIVGSQAALNLTVGQGLIHIQGMNQLLLQAKKFAAKVENGTIQSQSSEVTVSRTANYAGEVAQYEGRSGEMSIQVYLQAGLIQF